MTHIRRRVFWLWPNHPGSPGQHQMKDDGTSAPTATENRRVTVNPDGRDTLVKPGSSCPKGSDDVQAVIGPVEHT